MYFLLAQILFGVWAAWFAHFQVPINEAFIDRVPMGNPWSKPFHNRGGAMAVITAFIIGLAFYALTKDWHGCIYLAPILYCLYKILFDGVLGKEVHDNFFYLGGTSKQDRWIKERITGKVKVVICAIAILLLNITNYLL